MTKKTQVTTLLSWRPLLMLAVVVLAGIMIVPQVDQLQEGFDQLRAATPGYVVLALVAVCIAVTASGGTYTFLALKKVRLWHAVLVQIAGMFVNRLLPAGVGGIGLNARFLYTHKHSAAQATTVAIMNNVLTGVGHAVILFVAVVVARQEFPEFRMTTFHVFVIAGIGAVAVLIAGLRSFAPLVARMHEFIQAMGKTVAAYADKKHRTVYAVLCAMINTSGHTLALFWLTQAFGVDLSLAVIVIVLTGGVVAASLTPTPGGVVGAEAALAAGFVGFGVDTANAIAIAVSYRIVSYWVPLIPGALTFFYIQKRRFI